MPTKCSGHALIPHLNVLQHLYLEPLRNDHDRYRVVFYNLELLPYTLGAACKAVAELAGIQHEISSAVTDDEFKEANIIGLGSEARDRMTFAVDAFLDAARRAQNAVIPYLTHGLSRSLPNSMSDLVGKMRKKAITLPERPHTHILKYWDEHGRRLKDYRDISQHHALVTSDARLFQSESGVRGLYFVLPSNPEEKSPARLRFGAPPMHAFPYVLDEFLALVGILYWLTAGLVPTGRESRMAVVVFRDGLTTSLAGHVVPSPDTVEDHLSRLRDGLEDRSRAS